MCKFKIRTLVFIFTILILLNIYSTSKLFEFSSKFRQNFIKFGNCAGVAIVIQNMNFFLSKMTIFRFKFGYFDIENGEFKVPQTINMRKSDWTGSGKYPSTRKYPFLKTNFKFLVRFPTKIN